MENSPDQEFIEMFSSSTFGAIASSQELLNFLTKDLNSEPYGTTKDFIAMLSRLYVLETQLLMDYARTAGFSDKRGEMIGGMKGMKALAKEHALYIILDIFIKHEREIKSEMDEEKFLEDVAFLLDKDKAEFKKALGLDEEEPSLCEAMEALKDSLGKINVSQKS